MDHVDDRISTEWWLCDIMSKNCCIWFIQVTVSIFKLQRWYTELITVVLWLERIYSESIFTYKANIRDITTKRLPFVIRVYLEANYQDTISHPVGVYAWKFVRWKCQNKFPKFNVILGLCVWLRVMDTRCISAAKFHVQKGRITFHTANIHSFHNAITSCLCWSTGCIVCFF